MYLCTINLVFVFDIHPVGLKEGAGRFSVWASEILCCTYLSVVSVGASYNACKCLFYDAQIRRYTILSLVVLMV